jgi:peptidoglycan hydrolase CwlO-like protein
MKKLILLLICASSLNAMAQSSATKIAYNKTEQPGLVMELPYTTQVAEDFIVENLKKIGYQPETSGSMFWKKNKVNGFYTFKGVQLDSNLAQRVDLYFKVEPKSRKEKDKSIVYLLVQKEDASFVSYETSEKIFGTAKGFMNSFVDGAASFKLDLDINDQDLFIQKEEQRLRKLREEEANLRKRIEQLQEDLKNNKADQEAQEKKIANEKLKLDELKAKKGS